MIASPRLLAFSVVCALVLAQPVRAQTLPGNDANPTAVNAYGMLVAANTSAIEQSRLLRDATTPSSTVDANGNALPGNESSTSSDDSFGVQQILKAQERVRPFLLSGGASFVFTNNAALTRNDAEDDVFAVIDAGIGWSSRIGQNLEANVGISAGIFRYNKLSELDFNSLGFGAGLTWTPASLRGVSFTGRYDFTELLSRGGDQILIDHALTLSVQKVLVFGRAHALTIGGIGVLDISDPHAAERSQLGAFVSYHAQISRKLEADLLFRPAANFYTDTDRVDWNNIVSLSLRYRFSEHVALGAFFSYGLNRSSQAEFDYNAATTGAGIGLDLRF